MSELAEILEWSKAKTAEVMAQTPEVQQTFDAGRPNSSAEATVEDTLKALEVIVTGMQSKKISLF